MRYLQAEKADYELKLSEINEASFDRCAGGMNNGGAKRLTLALALLDLGVEPEDVRDGLMINSRVVVAVNTAKYRCASNYEWKRYYELPFVVAVAKGERYLKTASMK